MAYTNQQTLRAKLHHQFIDVENRPCSNPDCATPYDRREIHRIIHGGEYIESNILVRCFGCHHYIDHPNSKFRVGDKACLNGRTPADIELPRHRPRTIIAVKYDAVKQCNFYLIGSNGRGANAGNGQPLDGVSFYWFRSYQLVPVRRYHYIKHRRLCVSLCDKQEGFQNTKAVVDYQETQEHARI